jgi:hypothetical protein
MGRLGERERQQTTDATIGEGIASTRGRDVSVASVLVALQCNSVVPDQPDVVELGELRRAIQNGILAERPLREVTFDLFKDANGEPRMLHSAVLFLDTVGTTAASISPDAETNLRRFHRAITLAAKMAGTEHPGVLQATTWFTDNVVVALPVAAHQSIEYAAMFAALTASELAVNLLQFGILARGGIAIGRVYLDDRFVFGPALIAAHNLEKMTAEPRVLLDDDAALALMQEIDTVAFETTGSSPYRVYRDLEDAALFTNHFDIAFSGREPEPTLVMAQDAETDSQRAKWTWARARFEEAAERWAPGYLGGGL